MCICRCRQRAHKGALGANGQWPSRSAHAVYHKSMLLVSYAAWCRVAGAAEANQSKARPTSDELLRPGQTDGDTRTPSNARNQRDAQACAICSRGTALPSARDAMIDARHVSLRATVWNETLENINVTNVIRATVQKRQSRTEVFVLHCPSLPAPWGGTPPPPTGIRRSVHNPQSADARPTRRMIS